MPVTAESITGNFQKAYPNDALYVCKFRTSGGYGLFYGTQLLNVQLENKDWLTVFKLEKSSAVSIDDDIVKQKAFPFVYDTKGIIDNEARCVRLRNSLKTVFSNHYVNIFIYNEAWEYNGLASGFADATNKYVFGLRKLYGNFRMECLKPMIANITDFDLEYLELKVAGISDILIHN
ncbi:unnamed protein product [Rotaria sp. Silwood1]|nr:unnamed protein product [Rotaria sp. Silwood1]